ncbi:MAG: 3-dehydroquinate dehydratase [Bacteroidales bacterium]|nr:3-dehydroquinate dehydratase [Bacteroidales bacterium]
MKILILNGPNLNLIGRREPHIYGTVSLVDYIKEMKERFPEHQLDYFQSNHEGVLIDKLHEAWDNYDGVVFNPGAYCHTSIALADAIRSIETPVVEVHISDIYSREEYRRHSYTAEASVKSIVGKGLIGYDEAVGFLINNVQFTIVGTH